jgi:hypothetical protein
VLPWERPFGEEPFMRFLGGGAKNQIRAKSSINRASPIKF